MPRFLRQYVIKFKKCVMWQEWVCFRRSEHVFGLFGSVRIGPDLLGARLAGLWRVMAVNFAHESTVEEYKGRAKRIQSRIWNGTTSRFGLSKLEKTPVGNSGRQVDGISADDCGSSYRLYGRDFGWSIQWGERFVLRRGESRCFWTCAKACQRATGQTFRESSATPNQDRRDSGGMRKVVLREVWQSDS